MLPLQQYSSSSVHSPKENNERSMRSLKVIHRLSMSEVDHPRCVRSWFSEFETGSRPRQVFCKDPRRLGGCQSVGTGPSKGVESLEMKKVAEGRTRTTKSVWPKGAILHDHQEPCLLFGDGLVSGTVNTSSGGSMVMQSSSYSRTLAA